MNMDLTAYVGRMGLLFILVIEYLCFAIMLLVYMYFDVILVIHINDFYKNGDM